MSNLRLKKTLIFAFAFLSILSYATSIQLTSQVDTLLSDMPFVLSRAELKKHKENCVPVLVNAQGNYVPSQLDDIDGDGRWDELAFLIDVQPKATQKLKIKWVSKKKYPTFTRRANVHYGKTIAEGKVIALASDTHNNDLRKKFACPYQMDGIAWENDKMGYRHYYDGRNCRDVFGKRTAEMVLDKVGIQPDGNAGDTYHVMADWGRDILSAKGFGMGGIALLRNDSLIRLGVLAGELKDNVDSTSYRLINKGVVRGVFDMNFMGWNIDGEKINLTIRTTIWGGTYGYETKIIAPNLPDNCSLVTGIVNNNNDQPYTQEKLYGQEMMYTHDKQTYNKEFYLGLGLLIPNANFKKAVEAPKEGNGITTTWCAVLKPDQSQSINYKVLSAWEIGNPFFANRQYFDQTMRYEALKWSKPVAISIVK